MGARQDADFDVDLADLVELAAIRTAAVLQHLVAEDALLERVEAACLASAFCSSANGSTAFFLHASMRRVAFELLVLLGVQRVLQLGADGVGDLIVELLVELRRRELALRLAGLLHQLADGGGDLLAAVVAELDGVQHLGFGGLLRAGFHHHDAVFGAGDDDVDLGGLGLFVGGIGDQLAVHHADANAAQHVMERNIGDGERRARADDGRAWRGRASGSAESTMPMTCVSCE